MRWKLVVLVSIVAALVASLCWFGLIILFFNGSAAILPVNPQWWPLSLILPLLLAVFGGFFIYRHTSRRRKTQAAMTFLAVLALTALLCFAVILLQPSRTAPSRLLFFSRSQANFSLHRRQRINYEPNVLVEFDT